ncbi:MAG: hypothetical protein V3T83_16135 [Acidobacteriota bacterium]
MSLTTAQLGQDGIYRPASLGDSGRFQSAVLEGLWIDVDWLWQQPPPSILSVLKKWNLV